MVGLLCKTTIPIRLTVDPIAWTQLGKHAEANSTSAGISDYAETIVRGPVSHICRSDGND